MLVTILGGFSFILNFPFSVSFPPLSPIGQFSTLPCAKIDFSVLCMHSSVWALAADTVKFSTPLLGHFRAEAPGENPSELEDLRQKIQLLQVRFFRPNTQKKYWGRNP